MKIQPSKRSNNFMLRLKPTRHQAAVAKWFNIWRVNPYNAEGKEAEQELKKLGATVKRETIGGTDGEEHGNNTGNL